MKFNQDALFDQLTNELTPKRFWSPTKRTGLWLFAALLLNTLAFLAYQAFRPGFVTELQSNPRFLIESISSIFALAFFIYVFFCQLVPGYKTNKNIVIAGAVTTLIFLASVIYSFFEAAPLSTRNGARAFCVEEVLLYGILGMVSFLVVAKKGDFPLTRKGFFMAGAIATLAPGILMQFACAYSPLHNLLVHYIPAVVVGLIALIYSLFKKTR